MSFTTDLIQPFEIKSYHTTDDIKDNEYRKELINAINSVFDITNRKLNQFVSAYRALIDREFKMDNTLTFRHFFLELLKEANNDLRKNDKQYRINLIWVRIIEFEEEDKEYLKYSNLYNDDGSINNYKLQQHLNLIEKIITTYTPSKKLYVKIVHVDEHLLSIFL